MKLKKNVCLYETEEKRMFNIPGKQSVNILAFTFKIYDRQRAAKYSS